MTDKPISQLDAETVLSATAEVVSNRGGVTRRSTVQLLLDVLGRAGFALEDADQAILNLGASEAGRDLLKGSRKTATIYRAGEALPATDIGPILHEDFGWRTMLWRTFNQNGASWSGYASLDIGQRFHQNNASLLPGRIKANGASYSAATYEPLWSAARHFGMAVPLGSWAAGMYYFADNGDGTFRVPDVRAEMARAWDDGRGVDTGRNLGSHQGDAMRRLVDTFVTYYSPDSAVSGELFEGLGGNPKSTAANGTGYEVSGLSFDNSRVTPTAAENRPRNFSELYTIQFI